MVVRTVLAAMFPFLIGVRTGLIAADCFCDHNLIEARASSSASLENRQPGPKGPCSRSSAWSRPAKGRRPGAVLLRPLAGVRESGPDGAPLFFEPSP